MSVAAAPDLSMRLDLSSAAFHQNKQVWYRWLLEEAPVHPARVSVLRLTVVSRYDDCRALLADERFLRNRGRARGRGTSPFPVPLPRSVAALARSMILEDDPAHRRLRGLVNQAFLPHAIERLLGPIEAIADELLDGLEGRSSFDLLEAYARPLPTRVIALMLGLESADLEALRRTTGVLTKGLSGPGLLRTLLWDLRVAGRFVRSLIERKRRQPGDDVLTGLIDAEEEGDRLSEDELVAMVFLLVIAGFETTLHLIGNGARALIEHPDSLARLRADGALWFDALEEILRCHGPIHGTKLLYPCEDVAVQGHRIARGSPVMPLLGAANLDPRAFEAPERFDVARSPNRHLAFGFGAHFCLGAQLARLEGRIALSRLFTRFPELSLAVDGRSLPLDPLPGWHRHRALPVRTCAPGAS